MNITLADFSNAAAQAMQTQGLSGEDSVIHMREDGNSVNATGRAWRRWGSSGRTTEFKEANRTTRQALLDALSHELGINFTQKKEIPAPLLKALNLDKFSLDKNGIVQSNKPLTARRITLISRAVEQVKNARVRAATSSMCNTVTNELKARMPGMQASSRNALDRVAYAFSSIIANGREAGHGVDRMANAIVRNIKANAPSYRTYRMDMDKAFPALQNEGFTGLTDQVKDFVTKILNTLPNGGGAPASKAEEEHTFNFQAEEPVSQAKSAVQPEVGAQKAEAKVTVKMKMNYDAFFTLMQSRLERALEHPGVDKPRYQPRLQDTTQFLRWISGLATGPNSYGKIVRNAQDLADLALSYMQKRNNVTLGLHDATLFPDVKKAVQLTSKGTSPQVAWQDIRADLVDLITQALDIKVE